MAIQTTRLGSFDEDRCVWEVDWDDQALILTRLRCINNSSQPSQIVAHVQSTGRNGTLTAPAGQTTTQNLPQTQQTKLDITINPNNGRIDGIDYSLFWPALS